MDKDNIIWCNFELGTLNQTIHCPNGEIEQVPSDYLADTLVQKCKDYDKQEIYLFGYHPQYLETLAQDIKEAEKIMYGINNINIFCEGDIL